MGIPLRHYKIEIDGGSTVYDSAPNGTPDPGALLVEMDLTVTEHSTPLGSCFVRIWGVGIQALSQAKDLYFKDIKVSGGMAKGLPLAKPQQFGLLVQGKITKAFGNWQGTDQSLDLFITPGEPNKTEPDGGPNPKSPAKNIVFNGKKDQDITDVLKQTLQTAFPSLQIKANVQKQLKLTQDQIAYFPNIDQLGYFIRRLSQDIGGKSYQGISITDYNGNINLVDAPSGNSQISFEDLVGQPTWIDTGVIQVKTVMRGDLDILSQFTLPQTWINSSESANYIGPGSQQQLAFQGQWQINKMRHVGNSRATSADAWVSIFDCGRASGSSS